jgi:hypothetical protein
MTRLRKSLFNSATMDSKEGATTTLLLAADPSLAVPGGDGDSDGDEGYHYGPFGIPAKPEQTQVTPL